MPGGGGRPGGSGGPGGTRGGPPRPRRPLHRSPLSWREEEEEANMGVRGMASARARAPRVGVRDHRYAYYYELVVVLAS